MNNSNLGRRDQALIEKVKENTQRLNINNVIRTNAYLNFFLQYPEIHWAFLAHMVSRNGGWNMTDLQGEFLPRLMSQNDRYIFFRFLERSNWLIFQDAYPQLLIYEESVKQNKPLFYLLPFLGVSVFMVTIWDYFWRSKDPLIMTKALIINEQNYLESRVVQNQYFQNTVFKKFEFLLQDLLSYNQILLPLGQKNLSGLTVHQFESLNKRIIIGKKLYKILFKEKEVLTQSIEWAKDHPHTGSRKDYWPHIFNNVNEGTPGTAYQLKLKSCQLKQGASKIYSPSLVYAWKNVTHEKAEIGDWFKDWNVVSNFFENNEEIDGEILNEYCKTLEQLELTVLFKKAIQFFE
ncbi:hypothetical protein QE429_002426 [Bacillus sp. SORGH_AS 510]|uniref:DUF2515 family protein n=1 Tax=Bacillus sp. SORGH_AS_0510 TaxID=3041771 RepID=UPI002788CD3D|nr:DUF2515 family protein [Bacillus sp. SORGH_AS_0510]MDQ1145599.1 hypothetical protein [Bacillus sp. SORGH_AS_0510]